MWLSRGFVKVDGTCLSSLTDSMLGGEKVGDWKDFQTSESDTSVRNRLGMPPPTRKLTTYGVKSRISHALVQHPP